MRKFYTSFLLLFIALPYAGQSQVLAWNLTSLTGITTSVNATTVDPNLAGSTLTRSGSLTATSLSAGFAASGFNVTTQTAAESGNLYFQFTLTTAASAQASLSSINATLRRTSTGPNVYQWEYSTDGFATTRNNIGGNVSFTTTGSNGDVQGAIDLTGISALQSIAGGTTITFRIYAWGASAATGTFAVGKPSSGNSLAINGTTVSTGVTVNPPAAFSATATSGSEIDLSGTADAANDNIVIAYNTSAAFGLPSGALTAGASITGGGTVLYNGPTSALPFQHTGLNPSTQYFYSAWSVDGSNNYSSALTANATTANPPAHSIVINQVYGGGGNSGAQYSNDFIELYNNETSPVNLAGWSVQYTSATGSGTWIVSPLSGTIPANGFFLIQLAAGATPSGSLPTPDLTPSGSAAFNMSATAGKVLLANTTQQLTGQTPQDSTSFVVDLVGYGSTANDYENLPAPGLTNTTSITRVPDGSNTVKNNVDFQVTVPNPRNAAYSTSAPAISVMSPGSGATDVPATYVPYLVTTKPLIKGAGSITLYVNGTPGTPIDVSNAVIVVSNDTVTFNLPLAGGDTYAISFPDGTFMDKNGHNLPGLTTATAWSFTTYNNNVPAALPYLNDFETCTGNGLLSHGFTQYSVTGAQAWNCSPYGADTVTTTNNAGHGVEMNGYANSIDNLNEDWLISPKFDLSGTTYPLLAFWSRNAYAGAPLQLMISTDYTGSGDPHNATWTTINGKFPSVGSDTWTRTANLNLSAFKQTSVYIAFVYTSTTQDGSRWDLDDISLVNSSTPPPPSLTLSTADLEFGYAPPGTPVTKRLTVTGNDLTSNITVTSEGSYLVSTDSVNFSNSITIAADTANNLAEPVFVRFNPATVNSQFIDSVIVTISDSTAVVDVQGNSIDPSTTLSVVDWNLNWFGTPDPTLGVADKSLQETNVGTILPSLHADLYALEEVVNQHALDSIVGTMPGYSYVIGQYGSYSNPAEPTADTLGEVQKLAFVYNTAKIQLIRTDSLLTLGVTNPADIKTLYYNDWASGRFPYMLTANVTLNDPNTGLTNTKLVHFINIHAKSNLSPVLTSYARRQDGARALDSLIKASYLNENVMILGDFNDDLNQTITAGVNPPITSYNAFTITDSSLYKFPTQPLSLAGQHSDVNYTSVIDNVIVNNTMASWYLPSSATVLSNVASLVTNYGTTTTDHYPVFSQFSFTPPVPLPVKLVSFTGVKQDQTSKLTWVTSSESNSKVFNIQRSSSSPGFTTIGTVTAAGNSSANTTYTFTDEQPLNGDNYYRLQQVDIDGKFTYSNIVRLSFSGNLTLKINPNPAHGTANLYIGNATQTLSVQLIDLDGQLIRQWSVTPGTTTMAVDVNGIAKGLYTVKAVSASGVVLQKLLVQ